jgi:hypothetical protein
MEYDMKKNTRGKSLAYMRSANKQFRLASPRSFYMTTVYTVNLLAPAKFIYCQPKNFTEVIIIY